MTIQLTRTERKGKAVYGTLGFILNDVQYIFGTMENADYIIPAGRYPLKMTWSPKFKKNMPEICDVPEREGIRLHCGTAPEHSLGCVLFYEGKQLDRVMALETLKAFINFNNKYNEEDLFIEIID